LRTSGARTSPENFLKQLDSLIAAASSAMPSRWQARLDLAIFYMARACMTKPWRRQSDLSESRRGSELRSDGGDAMQHLIGRPAQGLKDARQS